VKTDPGLFGVVVVVVVPLGNIRPWDWAHNQEELVNTSSSNMGVTYNLLFSLFLFVFVFVFVVVITV
jgi:hypothetical protein